MTLPSSWPVALMYPPDGGLEHNPRSGCSLAGDELKRDVELVSVESVKQLVDGQNLCKLWEVRVRPMH
jgi:hypothetical protein